MGGEVEGERGGTLVEAFDLLEFEFFFGVLPTQSGQRRWMFDDVPEDARQFMRHGRDRFGRPHPSLRISRAAL